MRENTSNRGRKNAVGFTPRVLTDGQQEDFAILMVAKRASDLENLVGESTLNWRHDVHCKCPQCAWWQ